MFDLEFGKYQSINSSIHKANPIIKIISLFIYSILLFLTNDIKMILFMFILLLILIYLSNISIKKCINSLKIVLPFLIIAMVINIVFSMSFIHFLIAVLKIGSIVLYSNMIMFTTTQKDITQGITSFLRPLSVFNVNIDKVAFTITLAIRFIPNTLENSKKILKAQTSRGIDFKEGNFIDKARALRVLIIPLFAHSFRKGDEVSALLELRGFEINQPKTKHKIDDIDIFILLAHIILIILYIIK